MKVLVVDDDLDLCSLIARFLRGHGYTVLTAPDGVQAKEILLREPMNLVITDLMMPHLDGIRFSEQLRALPQYQDLPIILITAYPSDELADKGMRKGVAMTLAKPLDLNKLLDLVGFATH
ncbi:MAG: response regulator [Myxococcales bacterium]|nr:response regulator [Myxococcales bacterium]